MSNKNINIIDLDDELEDELDDDFNELDDDFNELDDDLDNSSTSAASGDQSDPNGSVSLSSEKNNDIPVTHRYNLRKRKYTTEVNDQKNNTNKCDESNKCDRSNNHDDKSVSSVDSGTNSNFSGMLYSIPKDHDDSREQDHESDLSKQYDDSREQDHESDLSKQDESDLSKSISKIDKTHRHSHGKTDISFELFDHLVDRYNPTKDEEKTDTIREWMKGIPLHKRRKIKQVADQIYEQLNCLPKHSDILMSKMPFGEKCNIIEQLDMLDYEGFGSPGYFARKKDINRKFNNYNKSKESEESLQAIEKESNELNEIHERPLKMQILTSDVSSHNKSILLEKLFQWEMLSSYDSSKAKLFEWISWALKISDSVTPLEVATSDGNLAINRFLYNVKHSLDSKIYKMVVAKEKLLELLAMRISNPNAKSMSLALCGPPGVGKCLHPNTQLLLFFGGMKAAKDIIRGDILIGDDNQPRIVMSTTNGTEQMYKILPEFSDPFIVNKPHVLTLYNQFTNLTVDMALDEYLEKSEAWKSKHKLYSVPVDYNKQDVKNDPYMIGIVLGGNTKTKDQIIKDYLLKRLNNIAGYVAGQLSVTSLNLNDVNHDEITYIINHKYIPDEYIYNTRDVRYNLLKGFLDARKKPTHQPRSKSAERTPPYMKGLPKVRATTPKPSRNSTVSRIVNNTGLRGTNNTGLRNANNKAHTPNKYDYETMSELNFSTESDSSKNMNRSVKFSETSEISLIDNIAEASLVETSVAESTDSLELSESSEINDLINKIDDIRNSVEKSDISDNYIRNKVANLGNTKPRSFSSINLKSNIKSTSNPNTNLSKNQIESKTNSNNKSSNKTTSHNASNSFSNNTANLSIGSNASNLPTSYASTKTRINVFKSKIPLLVKHETVIPIKNKILHEQIKFIIRSLGYKCISIGDEITVFGDLNKLPPQNTKIDMNFTVIPDDSNNYCGFTLDKNGRFLLASCIVTHNTQLIQAFSEAINQPFVKINMGGNTDPHHFLGHTYTYDGSTPGVIVKAMTTMKTKEGLGTKCGTILFDEFDKLGQKSKVGDAFLHISDPVQQKDFQDQYMPEIKIDLSHITFVYSMNDKKNIDFTLLNRLPVVDITGYSEQDKHAILLNYIIPRELTNSGFSTGDVKFDDHTIREIITATMPIDFNGVRKAAEVVQNIIKKINALRCSSCEGGQPIFSYSIKDFKIPIVVTQSILHKLKVLPESDQPYLAMYV
jgi:ATP-dependent Lon protease